MEFNWHKLIEFNDVDMVFIEMLFLSEDTSNRSISNSLLTKKLLSARCLLCQCLTVQFFVSLREFKLCIRPLRVLQWRQIVGSFGDSWVKKGTCYRLRNTSVQFNSSRQVYLASVRNCELCEWNKINGDKVMDRTRTDNFYTLEIR